MRKKYIIINTLILLVSLFLLFITSIFLVYEINERNTNTLIKNYLSVIETEYDGTNMESVATNIHKSNTDVRITFISKDGVVLYDTSKTSEESHLNRPEIMNVGTISKRYSGTTEVMMYYLAAYDEANSVYIRVSIPESSVSDVVTSFSYIGIIGIFVIGIISFLFIYITSKKLVKPLKKEITNLSYITNSKLSYNGDDIYELSRQIQDVRKIIDSNIASIKRETLKLNYIIDNMNSGLIIISANEDIILINNLALDLLNQNRDNVINKSYKEVLEIFNINNDIEYAINNDSKFETIYKSDDKIYSISISSLYAAFAVKNDKAGVSIFIHDITEVKRLEQVKLDFFSNASHELKSPLTTIIGYQQMISEGIITDDNDIKEATSKTIKEATRMNQIIIEMLELSKLEIEANPPKKQLSIAKTIEGLLESFDVILDNKNIEVIKEYNDFNIYMNMDEIYHVIRNLLENAIKYNKENGNIIINIDNSKNTLSIKDSGIGISNDNLNRIFERFYRVDKAKSRNLGGTGLGLAIVKHICLNNNLKIEVKSELGLGSEFIIDFSNVVYKEE